MASPRTIIRIVFSATAALVVFPVAGLVVEKAIPPHWLSQWAGGLVTMLTFLSDMAVAPWFGWLAGGVVGCAMGLWADAFLKRREGAVVPDDAEAREALAKRGEGLAQKIADLTAEHAADRQIAWYKDSELSGTDATIRRDNYAQADAKAIEHYVRRHHSAVLAFFTDVKKYLAFNMWHLQHGVSSPRDIDTIHGLIVQAVSDLRNPRPDVVDKADYDRLLDHLRTLEKEKAERTDA